MRFLIVCLLGIFLCFATYADAIAAGAIDVNTGQYFPSAAGGVIDPISGTFHHDVGGGYVNTRTGQFSPKIGGGMLGGGGFDNSGPTNHYKPPIDPNAPPLSKKELKKLKREKVRRQFVLDPAIFNPQPKDPLIINIEGPNLYEEGVSAFRSRNFYKAFYILSRQTKYTAAIPLLAYMYEFGYGVEKDMQKAVNLYIQAAVKGHAPSQLIVAHLYSRDGILKQDYNESRKWYLEAAEQGNVLAQKKLGEIYALGVGVATNKERALKWYSEASLHGDKNSKEYVDLIKHASLTKCQNIILSDLEKEPGIQQGIFLQ